jgi:hypothetical protein
MSRPNSIDYDAFRREAAALRSDAQQRMIRHAWHWLASHFRLSFFAVRSGDSMRRVEA